VEQWWQFVVDNKLGCQEVGAYQKDSDTCAGERVRDLIMPCLSRRNSRVVPDIKGGSSHKRAEVDLEPIEPSCVRAAVANENVAINCTHGLLVV
jgi:hypothetical protein